MKITTHQSPGKGYGDQEFIISAHLPLEEVLSVALLHEAIKQIAARYVEEHYQEIAALLDPQALANLTVAEAAAQVNKTLREKLPDKILEVERTTREVYQRGLLGGLKKL